MHELITGQRPFTAPSTRDSRLIVSELTRWRTSARLSEAAADLIGKLLTYSVSAR
jgi:hypothetical protein